MADKTTILITGVTGFIGSKLARKLLDDGFIIKGLVRDESRLSRSLSERIQIHKGDLIDSASLEHIEDNVDYVVNCAGALGKWKVAGNILQQVNVTGARNLLQRFVHTSVKRFIHLSAGGVTGPLNDIGDEATPCHPATAYEKTKLEGEKAVLVLGKATNVPVTVIRPTFTYGPDDTHKLSLFKAVKKGKFAFIGDGESVNHPVYIDDLTQGISEATRYGKDGEVYIIGGPRAVTKNELIDTIATELGVPSPRLHIPRWFANLAACAGELFGSATGIEPLITRSRVIMMDENYGYSIEKVRKELHFQPKIDLREGISRTIASYKQNQWL